LIQSNSCFSFISWTRSRMGSYSWP